MELSLNGIVGLNGPASFARLKWSF